MSQYPVSNKVFPPLHLVGAGVVGRSIAAAHLAAGLPVYLSDLNPESLHEAMTYCQNRFPNAVCGPAASLGDTLTTVTLRPNQTADNVSLPTGDSLAIESISETRDAKRAVLSNLQRWLGKDAILCTNTSTLRIDSLTDSIPFPNRCCGMHFFMPVEDRPLVEIVVPKGVETAVIERARQHAGLLGKQSLTVADSPGFVVNRMLAPYLNEAMRLLVSGATADDVSSVAKSFGMPMSPFELIDWIGTRTAFDSGRVYWQAFPKRIDANPLLPAMLKKKRFGRATGSGFYNYDPITQQRSHQFATTTNQLIQQYTRQTHMWTLEKILFRLSLPMLIEAFLILSDRVVDTVDSIDLAMQGGLGFSGDRGFFATFDRFDREAILDELKQNATERSYSGSERLVALLQQHASISEAARFLSQNPNKFS